MKNKPYTCPRCGYETNQKCDIQRHFYKRKKPCPGQMDSVELTEEVIRVVLENRVYIVHKEPLPVFNTTINNYITNMDVFEKLSKYFSYNNINITGFEQSIEERYAGMAFRLETDSFKEFQLKTDNLYETIDDVSNACKSDELKGLNIYYDTGVDKISIFDGDWEESMASLSIKKIIATIQDYYWNMYECYLIRKIYGAGVGWATQYCHELLDEYYRFICCFDLVSYCKERADDEIIKNGRKTSYEVSERYWTRFQKVREKTGSSEANTIRKTVMDIVKKNSKRNIEHLNKKIMNLFKMDEGFKIAMCGET